MTRNQVSPTWVEFENGHLTLAIAVQEGSAGVRALPFGTIIAARRSAQLWWPVSCQRGQRG